jgi:cell division septation protein DedD
MDTAMRDLDQLRERGDESTGRKLGLFAMAAVLGVAAVFAMGIMIGRGDSPPESAAQDPLAQLALTPKAQAAAKQPEVVDLAPESLSFPSTLVDREDPIEAVARAAAAERAALAGEPPPPSQAIEPPPPPAIPVDEARPVSDGDLPAVHAATDQGERLARVAKRDPLVAQALPREPETPTEVAPHGRDGKYTLQVVSYDSADQAERFAKTLRARGHQAFVVQADVPGRGRFHRVRVGPFETRQEASQYRAKFERDENMHPLLVAQARD